MFVHEFIEAPQKGNGLEILVAAMLVCQPLAIFARVVEVEH